MGSMRQTVKIIGIGEIEDPFPEFPKETALYLFAGPCEKCGAASRFLAISGEEFCLTCIECGSTLPIGIDAHLRNEVTYVHWCRAALFESDRINLDSETKAVIDQIIDNCGPVEKPGWGVLILRGWCQHANLCLSSECPYRYGCFPGEWVVGEAAKGRR